MSSAHSPIPPPEREEPFEYTAENVRVVPDYEHVRARPSMYVGDVGSGGLHRLIYELVDAFIDDSRAEAANSIRVELVGDGGCRVSGESEFRHFVENPPQFLLTKIYIPGPAPRALFPVSTSLHGLSYPISTVLSTRFLIETARDGRVWRQEFRQGRAASEIAMTLDTESRGTTIAFWPDREIFREAGEFRADELRDSLRERAFVVPGLEIQLIDRRQNPVEVDVYHFPGGVAEYVTYLNRGRRSVHPQVIYMERKAPGQEFALAMQWTHASEETVICFANVSRNRVGGTHLQAFRESLATLLQKYGQMYGVFNEEPISDEDCRAGLTAVLSVNLPQPHFESANRLRLNNPEIQPLIHDTMKDCLAVFFECHERATVAICEHVLCARKARVAI